MLAKTNQQRCDCEKQRQPWEDCDGNDCRLDYYFSKPMPRHFRTPGLVPTLSLPVRREDLCDAAHAFKT